MIPFKDFYSLHNEDYTPRKGDLFFHGSPEDFENFEAKEWMHGLAYVTRNLEHAMEYAAGRQMNFGGPLSKSGYVYAYKIDPRAKIFDAKDSKSFKGMFRKGFNSRYGYTEIVQQDDVISKILSKGWDGILQRQAELGLYGDLTKKSVKRKNYSRRDGKEKWWQSIPLTDSSPFRGVDVLGIKPEFLKLVKKFSWEELAEMEEENPKNVYKNVKKI
jgi:hypothetical protein